MSCKERILLARLVAGIRSNKVRKSLLCIEDLTLEKAVRHVQVDEATFFQANQFHDMEKLGVISPHEEPSPWCHPIVIAPKKGTDELRICIDFTRLNKFIQHEYHLRNSPFEAVTSILREELAYFCKFDARHGSLTDLCSWFG